MHRAPEEQIGFLLKRLMHVFRHVVEARLRGSSSLSFAHFVTLDQISEEPGIAGAQLARRLLVTAQTMTDLLKRLEREGNIERRSDPNNRRADRWYIREEGLERLRSSRSAGVPVMTQMLSLLEPGEIADLRGLSGALRQGAGVGQSAGRGGRAVGPRRSAGSAQGEAPEGARRHRAPRTGAPAHHPGRSRRTPALIAGPVPHVESLHVHPVKSCAGFGAASVEIAANGFAHDREWVIVDPRDHFLTQRDAPRLALVRTQVMAAHLELTAPGAGTLRVPLQHEGGRRVVAVWGARCPAFDAGPSRRGVVQRVPRARRAADALRSEPRARERCEIYRRGRRAQLLHRRVSRSWCCRAPRSPICRAASAGRCRPSGSAPTCCWADSTPYAEDDIREIDLGEVTLRLVKPCTRCVITTTDQATGQRDGDEPLRTLKAYRFDQRAARRHFRHERRSSCAGVGSDSRHGQVSRAAIQLR